jgi:hypothetical protein
MSKLWKTCYAGERALWPIASEHLPYSGWKAVCVSKYATMIQVYSVSDACRDRVMVGKLVERIVYIMCETDRIKQTASQTASVVARKRARAAPL